MAAIDFVVEHALLFRVHDVDDRRLAVDGDRLFERAHAQLGVHLCRNRAGQLDALHV